MLRSSTSETITARLILDTGSLAGLEAPLHRGYYMIGRHAECQIRPKSRSVSRRHCLIHHADEGVRVMDVGSAAGTRINLERVDPKHWHTLADGDTLRCGKVQFRVSLNSAQTPSAEKPILPSAPVSQPIAVDGPAADPPAPNRTRPSMVKGEAWETFDVAGFLESEDTYDREERYDAIRSKNDARVAEQESDLEMDPFGDDSVLDEFEDADGAGSSISGVRGDRGATGQRSQPDRPAYGRLKRPGPLKRFFSFNWARQSDDSMETIKLYAAIVLTIAVITFFGWKVYRFSTGPTVRVIEQIE